MKSWMKKNKSLFTISVLIGFLLTPFLWPFFLAVIYTALSLAFPVFLILLGIKMPWKAEKASEEGKEQAKTEQTGKKERERAYEQRENTFSQGKDTENGEASVPEPEETRSSGKKSEWERATKREAVGAWYGQAGKTRILNLMKLAERKGACGISIRKDGMCSAKIGNGYDRIGALRSFPGNDMEIVADMLRQDISVRSIRAKGKYLCIFWKDSKGERR